MALSQRDARGDAETPAKSDHKASTLSQPGADEECETNAGPWLSARWTVAPSTRRAGETALELGVRRALPACVRQQDSKNTKQA